MPAITALILVAATSLSVRAVDVTSADGPSFHATEADGSGIYCVNPWPAHCGADSLEFHGTWAPEEGTFLIEITYEVTLTCTVLLVEPTHVNARRSFTDVEPISQHMRTLTHPDGTVEPIFPAAPAPSEVDLDLAPGVYSVELNVQVLGAYPWPAYDGEVVLRWSPAGDVPVEGISWGGVKSWHR